jgi:hypothetical protein
MAKQKRPRKKWAKEKCVFCGKKAQTRDHIPPKCLFSRPFPEYMLTVPACHKCNSNASKDDEYFRNALVMREDAYKHPTAAALWDSKVNRSMKRFKHPKTSPILKDFKLVPTLTAGGIYLMEPRYGIETARIERTLARIVKGVFFCARGKRLPKNYTVSSIEIEDDRMRKDKALADKIRELIKEMLPHPWISVGRPDGTFGFKLGVSCGNEYEAHMLMVFYGKVVFLGTTHQTS